MCVICESGRRRTDAGAPQSLAEISLATGFADQSHFTRAFRRITGMSPGAFRRLVTPRVEYAFAAD